MKIRWIGGIVLAVVILFNAALSSAAYADDDMTVLRDNIVRQLTAAEPTTAAADSVAKIQSDGSFSDLDYTPNPLTNQPFKHVGRLHDMAVSWGCRSSGSFLDPKLKSAILKVYGFWVEHDIQHRNWWFNEIGVPDSLSETMLILQQHDALPAETFQKAIAIIDRALPRQDKLSAANLVWTAYATRNEGVLRYFASDASDAERTAASALVTQSFKRIGSTIKFTNSDGINVDFCFHAHGPMPYNGGYGSAWLNDTARIAASAAGTSDGLTHEQIKLMIDLVLEGNQFMVRGVNYDLAVTGRDWSRADHSGTALGLLVAVKDLLAVEPTYRAEELKTLESRLAHAKAMQAADPTNTAVGNRAYYTADYMAQQRAQYLISIKTVSKRTNLPEAMNGENGKGGAAYDGLNLIYRTGNEYDDIEPLWDWYRLPGTTSERAAGGVGGKYDLKPPTGKRGTNAIAGGASDGKVGAQAFQFNEYNVSANKSWFLFDRGEVAMGNSITEAEPFSTDGVVGTNINQTTLNGDVIYSTAAGKTVTLAPGQSVTPKGLRWVNHDSVGYFFPEPVDNATIRNISRTGAWTDINLGGYSAEKMTRPLFDLDLNHGQTPANGAYVYAVIPGINAAEMESYIAARPFAVLRNDAVAQAVIDNGAGTTEVNFFTNGDVDCGDGETLTLVEVGQSASVILRKEAQRLTVSVASPDHRAGPITLRLSGHYVGDHATWDASDGRTTLSILLPDKATAGSTVTQTFTIAP